MSDAFWGVLVGGLIGISGTIATIVFQHKQWKTNRRLEYLQQKRDRSLKDFEKFSDKLSTKRNINPLEVESDLNLRIPQVLLKDFQSSLKITNISEADFTDRLSFRILVIEKMGEYLKELDAEIDDLTK